MKQERSRTFYNAYYKARLNWSRARHEAETNAGQRACEDYVARESSKLSLGQRADEAVKTAIERQAEAMSMT